MTRALMVRGGRAVFAEKHKFLVKQVSIDPTDLAGSAVVRN